MNWFLLGGVSMLLALPGGFLPKNFVGTYEILCGVLFMVGMSTFSVYAVRCWGIADREIACGYTTRLTTAQDMPELFLLEYKTLAVLAGPGEPRPANPRQNRTEGFPARV